MASESQSRITTGQISFSGGIDSGKVPSLANEANPNGLRPDQLAWSNNVTLRESGIRPRPGFKYLCTLPENGLFQGASIYEPDDDYPYIVTSIAGKIYRVRVDTDNSVQNIGISGDDNPPTPTRAYFCQGEQFLVIQAGDYTTLPLFWDGVSMVRSRGLQALPLSGASFVAPAIGDAVKVTLGAPYAGEPNQIFQIGAYRYQQISYNQRYTVSTLANGTWPSVPESPAGQAFSIPAGATIRLLSDGSIQGLSLVTPITGTMDASGPPFNSVGTSTGYFNSSTLSAVGYDYTIGSFVFPNGAQVDEFRLELTANFLAAPGANEVWLVNIDDPRVGETITVDNAQSQLPAGGPMDYYMGRLWVASGREYVAGDIVGLDTSGTGQYQFRDSILCMTENTYTSGGGAFIVPSNAGPITALAHPANVDSALGEGALKVFTRKAIYSVTVSPDRADWVDLQTPLQRVEQINYGAWSDRSVIPVNGDLFYRSVDGVRSLIEAVRYFQQWGNTPVSTEMQLAIESDDKAYIDFTSSIVFNNRLLMTCQPYQATYGVASKGIMSMDFAPLSRMSQKLPPSWESVWEGLSILQLIKADFGGNERAFAIVESSLSGNLEVWEITDAEEQDNGRLGENRIVWSVETPSFDFNRPFNRKRLEGLEIWADQMSGRCEFKVEYRNDQNPCWQFWFYWVQCAARNNCEYDGDTTCEYATQTYSKQYRIPMSLPRPASAQDPSSTRPTDIGSSFQLRISVKGFCRIRGFKLHASPFDSQLYDFSVAGTSSAPYSTLSFGGQGEPGESGTSASSVIFGTYANPNGYVTAVPNIFYKNTATGEVWVKESGNGNTGWI